MKTQALLVIITTLLTACSATPLTPPIKNTHNREPTPTMTDLPLRPSQSDTTHHLTHLRQKWQLTAVQGMDYQGKIKGEFDLTDPTNASGHAGCNTFMFGMSDIGDDTLHIGAVASTRMACSEMALEQILEQLLPTLSHYKVSATNLTLFNDQGQALYFKAIK